MTYKKAFLIVGLPFLLMWGCVHLVNKNIKKENNKWADFTQIEYVKTPGLRVYTYYTTNNNIDKIKEHAMTKTTWIEGRATVVYYYNDKNSIPSAQILVDPTIESQWKKHLVALYTKSRTGKVSCQPMDQK